MILNSRLSLKLLARRLTAAQHPEELTIQTPHLVKRKCSAFPPIQMDEVYICII